MRSAGTDPLVGAATTRRGATIGSLLALRRFLAGQPVVEKGLRLAALSPVVRRRQRAYPLAGSAIWGRGAILQSQGLALYCLRSQATRYQR
jgi:hypothetical protein